MILMYHHPMVLMYLETNWLRNNHMALTTDTTLICLVEQRQGLVYKRKRFVSLYYSVFQIINLSLVFSDILREVYI